MNTLISVPVWGSNYFNMMNNLMIPSLLSNSKFLKVQDKKNILDIHADSISIKKILDSKNFKEISKYYIIELSEIDSQKIAETQLSNENKYKLYGELHYLSIYKSFFKGYNCMPIAPDVIFSEEFILNILKMSEQNKVIFQTSLRVDEVGFQVYNMSVHKSKFNGNVSIKEARDLLGNCLHAEMLQYAIKRSNLNFSPQRIILTLFGKTYLFNTDLHPIYIPRDSCKLIVDSFSGSHHMGAVDSQSFTTVLLNFKNKKKNFLIIKNDLMGLQIDITKPNSRSVAGVLKEFKMSQIFNHYKSLSDEQKYFYGKRIVLNVDVCKNNETVIYKLYKIMILLFFGMINLLSIRRRFYK